MPELDDEPRRLQACPSQDPRASDGEHDRVLGQEECIEVRVRELEQLPRADAFDEHHLSPSGLPEPTTRSSR